MTLKEVILPTERQKIVDFLHDNGLSFEQNVDRTLYMEEDGNVAATVSASGGIIKCLAVDPRFRSENLAVTLVSEMIKTLHGAGIYHYQVFTKPKYRDVFQGLGFTPLVDTDKVSALESGDGDINSAIDGLAVQIKYGLGISGDANFDIASVVINGNPFTEGHLQLVEYVASRHRYVLVFIVEEEGSYFSFKDRYALAYVATKPVEGVLVLPSTKYIVSKTTFPGYFLKTVDDTTKEYARYDAMLFDKYFMPRLGIKKRYVGSESSDYMQLYNDTLAEVLGDKLEIVPRFTLDGEVISAAHVRQLIEQGKADEAMRFMPTSTLPLFRGMVQNKIG